MTLEEYIQLKKQHQEILQGLQKQQEQLRQIRNRQSWWLGLSSNLAGNAIWDGVVWIGSRLLRKL